MENMGAIDMHIYIRSLFGVDIAGDVIPPVNDAAALSPLLHLIGKDRSEKPRTNYHIIVFHTPITPPL